MNDYHQQIPLNFKKANNQTFDDFIVESNAKTINNLKTFAESESTAYIFYLWGITGTGKSHLLNAFMENNTKLNKPTVLIHPKELVKRQNVSLIEMFDYVCIDDAELISNDELLEESLFFWINEVKQAQKKIVLASQISNIDEKWQLADLRSRLASGITHQLLPLSRQGVVKALHKQASGQGINLDDKVIQYLEKNCSMNMAFLKQLLNQIDRATLIHKKQVTIPLIKTILQTVLVK